MKQVVLVTGAASGLGNVIAEHFAGQGHQVILSASTLEKAENAKKNSRFPENIFPLKLDISVETDFHKAVECIRQQFNQLDVLINNATVTKATPVLEISAADFDWITQVNQRGTFQACQIIGKYMAEQGYGRIINMASLAGQNGGAATGAHYAASKGAIVTLTKIFAKEFAAKGVTVNAVAPGPMESPIVHSVVPDEKIEQFIQNIPVKALGSMEFIAETCALLASPNAHFVTGATWDINGGLFMR
ncbi:short chain dehydrogenase family protein [Acinetobacter sp. 263903-1]|uniref:SDR family NAD(P)-dependent oxidoreductase n=1 Tax=unclassified Acinetobacter calcoaceticus/baumannii complex TaxID=2881046 RepID=UPI00044EE0E1|nr:MULTISPECIES: SDR family oxidoreductase [unclassified Acinetobacter calcoaceticus/baumannii complex]EXB34009.1 short chain dehydrogenase family protein [Acinetobacter sp. 1461402]EXB73867.1 short chain dehydrogenase family protein [Acinetobacter sp. 230853]EXE14146.1 short chain dehydrogenase family protein [Acinetobacter sp. 983759]EXF58166.1 short chain dehydrogenase family protein [Acinetobacter sp. 1294596]KCX38991.1 short chain dehydrogenase family protein [Acinetobacter sp. 263903-1]